MACGACNFLNRKCDESCVFAPYFCSENMGAAQFRAIHKVFGASNFSKLLQNVPEDKRRDAVTTISYEAEAWIKNPIQGCLSNAFALQNEIAKLNPELAAGYAELAACDTSDEASLSEEYVDSKQSQMLSVISNSNPNVQQSFPWPIDMQSILSGNAALNTYRAEAEKTEQGSCSSFPVCAQWDINSLARCTAQQQVPMEMNALHFGHGAGKWSHQKHPDINSHVLDPRPSFG